MPVFIGAQVLGNKIGIGRGNDALLMQLWIRL
jgi:hypothetical protein